MADTVEEKVPATVAPGIPMKMVIIIAVATLVVGLGGAFAIFKLTSGHSTDTSKPEPADVASEGHAGTKAPEAGHGAAGGPAAIFDLDPFIVNLADTPEIRYLKITVKLELSKAEAGEELKSRMPQIRDIILVLLTSKDSAAIRTPQGKFQLRDEITQRVNGVLPKPTVRTAYFTEFVVQ